jgi:hypothetical protein
MGWRLLDPTDAVVDRQRILILDETEGCVKVLDNQRHTQDVSSPALNSISHFSNTSVILPPSAAGVHNGLLTFSSESRRVAGVPPMQGPVGYDKKRTGMP